MELQLNVRYIIREVGGNVRYDSGPLKGESYVVALLEGLHAAMTSTSSTGVQDIASSSQTIVSPTASTDIFMNVIGVAGTDLRGIIVGTGTTAVAIDDNVLATVIADGSSSGQLDYGLTAVGTLASASGVASYDVTRSFANNSGGTITVNEVGIYAAHAAINFMIVRDLVAASAAILAGETLTVVYTIKVAL